VEVNIHVLVNPVQERGKLTVSLSLCISTMKVHRESGGKDPRIHIVFLTLVVDLQLNVKLSSCRRITLRRRRYSYRKMLQIKIVYRNEVSV
jgi:hypothetical protein